MNSPPFLGGEGELDSLPANVRDSFDEGMVQQDSDGPDGVPCFWLLASGECMHYAHRPGLTRLIR
jgi:hypothetical protein